MTTSYAFSRKPLDMKPSSSYRAWKKNETGEEVKIDSVRDFPTLVHSQKKQTIFEGVSLASKLKDVLAAEEEAAVQKRLKKGETAEQLLRESCVVLPLLSSSKKPREALVIPDWVLDHSNPVVLPSFRPKSFSQGQKERYWARLGVDPTQTKLYDTNDDDNDSIVSMPAQENHDEEEDQPSLSEEE